MVVNSSLSKTGMRGHCLRASPKRALQPTPQPICQRPTPSRLCCKEFCSDGQHDSWKVCYTATVLPSGMVAFRGGISTAPNILRVLSYTTQPTGDVHGTGSMNSARDLAHATLLPNGKVLIAADHQAVAWASRTRSSTIQ